MLPYNKNLKELAKNLRINMTEAERCLWMRLKLKHLGYTFYRQKPVGEYIVDFYCPKACLVVEVDGGQHFTAEAVANDRVRDEYLRSLGLNILRYSNAEVLNYTDKVTEEINRYLEKSSLYPSFKNGTTELDDNDGLLVK